VLVTQLTTIVSCNKNIKDDWITGRNMLMRILLIKYIIEY